MAQAAVVVVHTTATLLCLVALAVMAVAVRLPFLCTANGGNGCNGIVIIRYLP
jgi:hypothetical protein